MGDFEDLGRRLVLVAAADLEQRDLGLADQRRRLPGRVVDGRVGDVRVGIEQPGEVERRFRERFGFTGTPIRISVRVREKRPRKS